MGLRASANGSLTSPVAELIPWATFVTISVISKARKQSVVRLDLMYIFSSRRVLAKSARALRVVISIAVPQSSRGKMLEMFWSSERNRPSMALA